jgi:hypothetical protein
MAIGDIKKLEWDLSSGKAPQLKQVVQNYYGVTFEVISVTQKRGKIFVELKQLTQD